MSEKGAYAHKSSFLTSNRGGLLIYYVITTLSRISVQRYLLKHCILLCETDGCGFMKNIATMLSALLGFIVHSNAAAFPDTRNAGNNGRI